MLEIRIVDVPLNFYRGHNHSFGLMIDIYMLQNTECLKIIKKFGIN